MDSSDFHIALICALPVEMAAAEGMLDEVYESLPRKERDSNNYRYGRIGKHNVVLACLPAGVTGTVSAASVADNVLYSFQKFKMGLMVGIGGGVPDMETDGQHDIRLGDIVVSKPTSTFGGVVQYDLGKTIQGGQFTRTGSLNRPPDALLTAVAALEAKHIRQDSDAPQYIAEMIQKYPKMRATFSYQGPQHDQLFQAAYEHPNDAKTCDKCDAGRLVPRPERDAGKNIVHYGTIASGNQVMRHGETRDKVAADLEALCFEMEAAGLVNRFPCLVIRGICDYADSHKNKRWQPHAAAVAAAYAKELLYTIPADEVQTSSAALPAAPSPAARPLGNVYGGVHSQGGQQFNQSSFSGNFYFGSQNSANQGPRSSSAQNDPPLPPLITAATLENFQDFVRVYKSAPDVHVKDSRGRTPLHMAALYGRQEIIEVLIRGGADVNAKTLDGSNALGGACGYGHLKVVCSLLEAGANIDAVDLHGHSALFWAVTCKRYDIVRLLVWKGADTSLKVGETTIFDAAIQSGDSDIARFLLEYRRDSST